MFNIQKKTKKTTQYLKKKKSILKKTKLYIYIYTIFRLNAFLNTLTALLIDNSNQWPIIICLSIITGQKYKVVIY